MNTLQAAIDVAAVLNEAIQYLVAVLDLTKAYDRVVRGLLVKKIERMSLPQDLVNQIIIFLVPLLLQTSGDVAYTIAKLSTGLTQGGSASPALFRIFIDDLSSDLRKALGRYETQEGSSLNDPAKLVADDVILLAQNEVELQILLDTFTAWANRKHLEWKPQKCSVISLGTTTPRTRQFTLAGQPIPVTDKARYLGIVITPDGFTKEAEL